FVRIPDVHIFNPDGITVNPFKVLDDFLQSGFANADDFSGFKSLLKVVLRKAEVFQCQGGRILPTLPNGIGFCEQMPSGAIAVNELYYLEFFYYIGTKSPHVIIVRIGNWCSIRSSEKIAIVQFRPKIEPLEKSSPTGFNTIWIL